MRPALAAVVLVAACGRPSGPHDELTDCPHWTSPTLHPVACERACEPKPPETAVKCDAATNPNTDRVVSCVRAIYVDGAYGCCEFDGGLDNLHIMYFECQSTGTPRT